MIEDTPDFTEEEITEARQAVGFLESSQQSLELFKAEATAARDMMRRLNPKYMTTREVADQFEKTAALLDHLIAAGDSIVKFTALLRGDLAGSSGEPAIDE